VVVRIIRDCSGRMKNNVLKKPEEGFLWHASVEVVEKSRHFSNVGECDCSFKIRRKQPRKSTSENIGTFF